jgi:2-phosphosulfolactate phosphatase
MNRTIRVHLLPALVSPDELAGRTVLVIDLLRASTTICHALANGAEEVVPFVEVDEARRAAAEAAGRGESVVCGGERGGVRIEGFDLGNSPREYLPAAVGGQRVLFTTSNGTRALHHAHVARRTLVACLANLSATLGVLQDTSDVEILCAGSEGSITREDVIAAGAYVVELTRKAAVQVNDSALVARDAWLIAAGGLDVHQTGTVKTVAQSLAEGEHGRRLISLGYADDLPLCAAIDSVGLAAEFDPRHGSIRVALPSVDPSLRGGAVDVCG